MPRYKIYARCKNSKMARPVLKGEVIEAVDARSACVKAVNRDNKLRISRLMAVVVPPGIDVSIAEVQPLTEEQRREMFKPEPIVEG